MPALGLLPRHLAGCQLRPQPPVPLRRLARLPCPDAVGPENEAAVVCDRQPVRQLEPLAGIAVRQVARNLVVAVPAAQAFENPPAQIRRFEHRHRGQRRHRLAHGRPGELGRELDAQVCCDTKLGGELQPQPLPQGRMRDDDTLGQQWGAGSLAHLVGQARRQRFQAMRRVYEHWMSRRNRHQLGLSWVSVAHFRAHTVVGVTGMVSHWLGGRSNDGDWVIGGIFRELAEAACARSIAVIPDPAAYADVPYAPHSIHKRQLLAGIPFDPFAMAPFLEQTLLDAGVDIRYETLTVDAIVENGAVTRVITAGKDGLSAVGARVFIDATGDADVAARTGCRYVVGDRGGGSWRSASSSTLRTWSNAS